MKLWYPYDRWSLTQGENSHSSGESNKCAHGTLRNYRVETVGDVPRGASVMNTLFGSCR